MLYAIHNNTQNGKDTTTLVQYFDDYCFSNDPTILTNKSGVDNKPTLKVKFNFGTNSFGMI